MSYVESSYKHVVINPYTVEKRPKDNEDARFECRNEFETYQQYGRSGVLCAILSGDPSGYTMIRASIFPKHLDLCFDHFDDLYTYCIENNTEEYLKWYNTSRLEVNKVFNILGTLVANGYLCLEQCYRFLDRAIKLNNEIYLFLDFDFDNIGLDDEEIVFIDYGHAALGG